jgi:hypothetical protein
MVESAKKFLKNVWASLARNGRFGVFFEKNGLNPLRVKIFIFGGI